MWFLLFVNSLEVQAWLRYSDNMKRWQHARNRRVYYKIHTACLQTCSLGFNHALKVSSSAIVGEYECHSTNPVMCDGNASMKPQVRTSSFTTEHWIEPVPW